MRHFQPSKTKITITPPAKEQQRRVEAPFFGVVGIGTNVSRDPDLATTSQNRFENRRSNTDWGTLGSPTQISRNHCTRNYGAYPKVTHPPATYTYIREEMVGVTGIEPVTPSMSTKCSPAELHPPISALDHLAGPHWAPHD